MLWLLSGVLSVVVLIGAVVAVLAARRLFHGNSRNSSDFASPKPRTDNPAAFMTASMQAVIQKLKEQEKELEALHRAERERAQQTERLSEAVTRNMPAGLLLLNSAGLITSANPAAELALGVKSLVYRRYNEILGADSRLTQLLAGCLDQGKTFRREEVEYLTPSHELRQLGVTISPIFAPAASMGSSSASERRQRNYRRDLPVERSDRTRRASKTDSHEGKSCRARRTFRGHRA